MDTFISKDLFKLTRQFHNIYYLNRVHQVIQSNIIIKQAINSMVLRYYGSNTL